MSAASIRPSISHHDRFGITMFMALSFHALVILGITFTSSDPDDRPAQIQELNITLVQTPRPTAAPPKEADYLAQVDNQGGGNTQEKVKDKSPNLLPSAADSAGASLADRRPAESEPTEVNTEKVLTTAKADTKVRSVKKSSDVVLERSAPSTAELRQRFLDIARLDAQNEADWQTYSKMPNTRFLSANTRRHKDAAYLSAWSKKVERFGNLNYPGEALRKRLSGELLMVVTLRPDGSLVSIQLEQSSGHKILDDAAVAIVKLAAPFAPVPPEVLAGKDQLSIARRWAFTSGTLESR